MFEQLKILQKSGQERHEKVILNPSILKKSYIFPLGIKIVL